MNIFKYKILYLIQQYQPISIDLLQTYINIQENTTFQVISTLFNDSHIKINNYNQFKNYVTKVANTYFKLYHLYTIPEQKWLIYFIIIQHCHLNLPQLELIIQDYEKLPNIYQPTNNMKKMQLQIKGLIIPYYITLNKKYKKQ